ncbi:MAG: UDP-N-acetylglucosamine 2-epimerase (non-hydrolyzing) [Sedimentibacter sp.]|uniref:non-hydrolyzing UDP-N-acetylglucosamine 2-epimerase n=1 Tax=Sedimentibacter sp. TaxID=1960295 RepID=UPI002982A1F3|nr:UDP-N-acetylglucosamine 2-epimerase (non-hydrolyzing) [Sedimentibacter sp.]MDW5299753.1 UDP-N-acetylglucosamine 2-epimerase (non-hydrolyzing) [Sedimentibacter sp.]
MKVLVVFGTRPEAVKMAPIVKALKNDQEHFISKICVTAQHRDMLDQVLRIFDIEPDYDLNIFQSGQTLTQITCRALTGLEGVIEEFKPDLILVQGDTTTVFSGALAAFYHQVKIGHVEAGLRSGNLYSPYPEEANRMLTGVLTDFHFAPTTTSKNNLLREGYDESKIFITGNTSIDALSWVIDKNYKFEDEILNNIDFENKKVILLTAHRRENIGEPMENIFNAVREIAEKNKDVEVIYPMHLNPKVREIARNIFKDMNSVHLIEPLDYLPFTNLMSKCYLVVTDSGGVQEEAPSLGKPVLVVRKETERPEGIEAGTAKLAGTKREVIYNDLDLLLNNEEEYKSMAYAVNPYGDGRAAEHIIEAIKEKMMM